MKRTIIPKETNFQKWLSEYRIHRESRPIVVGQEYDGVAAFDSSDGIISVKSRTIYYDFAHKALVSEAHMENKYRIFLFQGRMYDYRNTICAESCTYLTQSVPLAEFMEKLILKSATDRHHLDRKTLTDLFLKTLSPKIAGCYSLFAQIIADACLNGFLPFSNTITVKTASAKEKSVLSDN